MFTFTFTLRTLQCRTGDKGPAPAPAPAFLQAKQNFPLKASNHSRSSSLSHCPHIFSSSPKLPVPQMKTGVSSVYIHTVARFLLRCYSHSIRSVLLSPDSLLHYPLVVEYVSRQSRYSARISSLISEKRSEIDERRIPSSQKKILRWPTSSSPNPPNAYHFWTMPLGLLRCRSYQILSFPQVINFMFEEIDDPEKATVKKSVHVRVNIIGSPLEFPGEFRRTDISEHRTGESEAPGHPSYSQRNRDKNWIHQDDRRRTEIPMPEM
ncbi:DNA helicase mcm9 [Asimina triloba]